MKKLFILSISLITLCNLQGVTIIGIAGGTASGKTTLTEKIKQALPEKVTTISLDNYYRDISHKAPDELKTYNYDHPDAFNFQLLKEHLSQLKAGQAITCPSYSFITRAVTLGAKVEPTGVIIVEGIMLFTQDSICDLLDLKLYIETDDDIRLIRRIERDQVERGRNFDDIKAQYLKTVKPMHNAFIQPSKHRADFIVPGNKSTEQAEKLILAFIADHTI